MDFKKAFALTQPLRDAAPTLHRLFPTRFDQVLQLLASPEPPPGTTYEERFTALLSDEDSETKKSVTKRAVFQNRKSWIKRQIEESKLGKLWLHGKTREEMSSAEMDELWKHVNKLRTSGVSFENCEKITGLRKNCCRPGYKLWRDRNSAEVKALGEEFNRRIDHSFGLPSDEEERTKDEREETVFGDEFTDLDKYNELVDLYIQGEGKSMEEEIEKFKSQAQALDEIAAEKGVNLGIKWDVNSWTLDPNVGHPNNAEHTIGIKKTVRLSHRNELEKQIAEAKTTLQTLGIEFDTSKPDDSDGSFEPSESDEASEADEPYEPKMDELLSLWNKNLLRGKIIKRNLSAEERQQILQDAPKSGKWDNETLLWVAKIGVFTTLGNNAKGHVSMAKATEIKRGSVSMRIQGARDAIRAHKERREQEQREEEQRKKKRIESENTSD
ncbi:hypothetical protein PInf_011983 [Phytophthora infestans]|nr:hypothetical protein PInf_011983 [Phytophthora infestans]